MFVGNYTGILQPPFDSRIGLTRAVVKFQLPPLPEGQYLRSASFGVLLENVYNDSLNPTFGPVSLYHSVADNVVNLYTAYFYAEPTYQAAGLFIGPQSEPGQYHFIDVTERIALDYLQDASSSPVSGFRMQIDGLGWRGYSEGFYVFTGRSANAAPRLILDFAPVPEPAPLCLAGILGCFMAVTGALRRCKQRWTR